MYCKINKRSQMLAGPSHRLVEISLSFAPFNYFSSTSNGISNHMFYQFSVLFYVSFPHWRHEKFSKCRFGYDSTLLLVCVRRRVFWTPGGTAFYFVFIFFLRSLRCRALFWHGNLFPHSRRFSALRQPEALVIEPFIWSWPAVVCGLIQRKTLATEIQSRVTRFCGHFNRI